MDVMLAALESDNFNQGLRFALRTLEDMHNATRQSQIENGKLDARYNMPLLWHTFELSFENATQFGSKYFAEYLGKPEWTVSGNVFSVDTKV